jgi:predicted nucleotide-binding protein
VKPKIFIGSSSEASKIAIAVHAQLADVAECTPWTAGAFDLSAGTVEGLISNLRESDFGIFIFSAEDTVTIHGEVLNAARDNVVFEAGLFSGYLGLERCFIAIPQIMPIHIASDLLGITVGRYEDKRIDNNWRAAVNTFCADVK